MEDLAEGIDEGVKLIKGLFGGAKKSLKTVKKVKKGVKKVKKGAKRVKKTLRKFRKLKLKKGKKLKWKGQAKWEKGGEPFILTEHSIVQFPKDIKKLSLGLGWNTFIDLDAGCLCFDYNLNLVNVVNFVNLGDKKMGVTLSGDNLTGIGGGDDEVMSINLTKVPQNVSVLFFVIQVYTDGGTFKRVKGAYSRLVDETNEREICRYNLNKMGNATGVCMCSLYKDQYGFWRLMGLGEKVSGRMADAAELDCLRMIDLMAPHILVDQKYFQMINQAIQIRSQVPRYITCPQPVIKIKCKAVGVDKMDTFGKSDPYFILRDGVSFDDLYKSEIIKNTLNPVWKEATITVFNPPDPRPLELSLYDWDKNSSDDFAGSFTFFVPDIINGKNSFELIREKKLKKKNYKNSGEFFFDVFEIVDNTRVGFALNTGYEYNLEKVKAVYEDLQTIRNLKNGEL